MESFDEETDDNELFVVHNGPETGEAEDILKEALALHFKDSHGQHIETNKFRSYGSKHCPLQCTALNFTLHLTAVIFCTSKCMNNFSALASDVLTHNNKFYVHIITFSVLGIVI